MTNMELKRKLTALLGHLEGTLEFTASNTENGATFLAGLRAGRRIEAEATIMLVRGLFSEVDGL